MPRLKPEDVTAHIRKSLAEPNVMKKMSDGQNLILIARNGRGYWTYQWRDGTSARTKVLGNAPEMSPARARQAREELAVQRRAGIVARRGAAARRANPAPAGAAGKLFGEVVTEFLEGYWVDGQHVLGRPEADGWRGGLEGLEVKAYRRTLTRHAIKDLPVSDVDTDDVASHLRNFKPATAEKARQRVETILNYAKTRGYRDGENPARLKGHFEHIPRQKPPKVEHHPAMLSADVPAFMVELLALGTIASRALAFTILTAARTNETIAMRWREVDFKNKVWIVPAERMKENEEHRVPLSPAAIKLLGKPGKPDDHVFPSPEKGPSHPIWNKAMPHILHKFLKQGKISAVDGRCPVPHGFRTTFSGDWGLKNKYPLELRDMALSHAIGDAVITAYNRTTGLIGKELYKVRIPMMQKWNKFAMSKA